MCGCAMETNLSRSVACFFLLSLGLCMSGRWSVGSLLCLLDVLLVCFFDSFRRPLIAHQSLLLLLPLLLLPLAASLGLPALTRGSRRTESTGHARVTDSSLGQRVNELVAQLDPHLP